MGCSFPGRPLMSRGFKGWIWALHLLVPQGSAAPSSRLPRGSAPAALSVWSQAGQSTARTWKRKPRSEVVKVTRPFPMTRVRCRACRSPPAHPPRQGSAGVPGGRCPGGNPSRTTTPGLGTRPPSPPPRGDAYTTTRRPLCAAPAPTGVPPGQSGPGLLRGAPRGRARERPGFCSPRRCPPGPGPRARRAPEPNAVPAALTSRQRRPPPPPWPPCCVRTGFCFLAGWQADWAAAAAAALKAAAARACVARPLARPRGAAARLRVPGHQPRPRNHQLRMRRPAGRAPVGSGRPWQTHLAVCAVADFSNDSVKAPSSGMDCRVLGTR